MRRRRTPTRSRPRSPLTSAQRGYDRTHRQIRAAWKPQVQAGMVQCHAETCLMPSRWITPGEPWDLGHTTDRTGWTGPEHRRCSRADGATRGNKMRVRVQPSRQW